MKRQRVLAGIWAGALAAIVGLAALAPLTAPLDPQAASPQNQFRPPGADHPAGTDHFGRDVWSRTVWGGRTTLAGAALASAVAFGLGASLGAVSGGVGGVADRFLSRIIDIWLALPGLLMALLIVALAGTGTLTAAIGVGMALVPTCARLVRGAVLSVRASLFVEASRALGADWWRIVARHLLPNVGMQAAAFAPVIYAWALMNLAALEFLGLAGSPSVPSWGRLISEGRTYLRAAPWIAVAPGCLLTLSVLAVTGLSDARRDREYGNK